MKFSKALKVMKNGYLVKRPTWEIPLTLLKDENTNSVNFVDNFNVVQYPTLTADDFVADDYEVIKTVEIMSVSLIRNEKHSVYEVKLMTPFFNVVQIVLISFDLFDHMSSFADLAKTIRNNIGCVDSHYMKLDYDFLLNDCKKFWDTYET